MNIDEPIIIASADDAQSLFVSGVAIGVLASLVGIYLLTDDRRSR